MRKRRVLSTLLAVLLGVTVASPVALGAQSTAPVASNITVTNNKEGSSDTVVVTGVASGDIVTVYPSSTSITALANVTSTGTSATVTVPQLGKSGGTVYVTRLTSGNTESTRTPKTFSAEPVSTAPAAADISVTNNYVGTSDTVVVNNVVSGDVVKVYSTSTSTSALGSVTSTGTSATVSIPQINTNAGTLYVSVTMSGKWESPKTAKTYIAEPKSDAPAAADIAVTNNYVGTPDTVVVNNLASGDVVKVYSSSTATAALGSVTSTGTSATVSIAQVGTGTGSVYVTVKETGKHESARTSQTFIAEPKSDPLSASDITITNNPTGTADTVVVANVASGEVVKVYATSTATTALGSVTATGTSATVSISQIGTGTGTLYVTVKESGKHESVRTSQTFTAEVGTTAPLLANITVTNNYVGTADTVVVSSVASGDVVKVYGTSTSTTALGSVTSTGTSATVSIPQIGTGTGTLYVTLKNTGKNESSRTAVTFGAEPKTDPLPAADITITNNPTGTADTVVVANVASGEVIKVYATSTSTTALGSVTATGTSATVSIPQIGTGTGTLYVTVKESAKHESTRTSQTFTGEVGTTAPLLANITVTNNYVGTADTVVVSSVVSGDVVKVYGTNTSTTALGSVTSTGTSATVSIPQIGTGTGTLYVTLRNTGKNESTRTAVTFTAEPQTTALPDADITITNNPTGTADTVVVANVASGEVIKVYATATATTALGSVTATGTSATVSIPQIGTGTGTLHVTVKESAKHESTRTSKTFAAEVGTTAPLLANVTVTNNYVGTTDTVVVSSVVSGDVVKVYATNTSTTALGSVTSTGTSATVSIPQIGTGTGTGTLYVSLKNTGKNESTRTAVTFSAEPQSIALPDTDITITNNPTGTADTVVVANVATGEVIKVYATATSTTALGSVTATGTSATVSITQIGTGTGTLYVTVKESGKHESTRTSKTFTAETGSTALLPAAITVTNNLTGTVDTVVVTGRSAGDIVRVYNAATGGTALGVAVASGSSVTIYVPQLGATAGNLYVSVQSTGANESTRTTVTRTAEATTAAPAAGDITVVNGKLYDTITIANVTSGDWVYIYSSATGTTPVAVAQAGGTSVTLYATQLGATGGTVYVSKKGASGNESSRTSKTFTAE